MITQGQLRWLLVGLAGCGIVWWLLRPNARTMTTNDSGRMPSNSGNRPKPYEYWLDETIEASFPASDPPASTPVTGIAQRTT